jgi:hypothetical protein
MALGWAGLDSVELVAELYAARAAGSSSRVLEPLAEDDEDDDADGEISSGRRLLSSRDEQEVRKVADGRGREYRA